MKLAGYNKTRRLSFLPLRFLFAAALLLFPTAAWAANVTVDCAGATPGAFPSISAALATLDNIGPHTITVMGICVENVDIQSRERLTLQGPQGNMAILVNAANPPFWTLNVGRSRQVMFRRLIVRGGSIGIRADSASSVDIQDCIVEDNPGHGIEISEQSTIRINRTIIRNNGIVGLNVTANSTVSLSLGGPQPQFIHIHNNGAAGINANGSFVQINGGGTLENNGTIGININGGRLIVNGNVQENFIRGNGFGVNISGAAATFNGQNTIQDNGGIGVQVANGSSAAFNALELSDGSFRINVIEGHGTIGLNLAGGASGNFSGPNIIRNNGSAGFDLNDTHGGVNVGTVSRIQFSGGNQITNNIGPGVTARFNGAIALGDSAVSNNAEHGLLLMRQSVGLVDTGANISGNGSANVSCDTTSLVAGDLTGVTKIDCTKIERTLGPPRPGAIKNLPNPVIP